MHWRLQPYALEAATLCTGGCNPMHWRLQPYVRRLHLYSGSGRLRAALLRPELIANGIEVEFVEGAVVRSEPRERRRVLHLLLPHPLKVLRVLQRAERASA